MSAVPPSFLPQTSFSTLAQQPISSAGLPGSELDGEFARASDSINQIKSRLSEVQRDDGKLRNDIVGITALSGDVRNLLASSTSAKAVTWSVGAQFAVGDLVSNPPDTPGTYLCITAHTSSSLFVNDLAKWALIAAPPAIGMLYTNTFTGNGTTTVFTLSQAPASKNNTQLFIDGIYQPKDGYLLNGQILTITPAPSAGSDIEVSIGVPSTASTVPDGAISTTKLADEAVTTPKIFDLSVTSGKIANSAISTAKIQDEAVTGVKLAAGSVGLNKLADGAVSSVKIADGAVISEKIADNAVISSKIANNAVTQAKLEPGSVVTAKIADSNVTTAKIADSNVTTAKIADASITAAKLNGEQTGSAPIFGCRAYGSFNGQATSPISPIASGNVSTIVRTGTGFYRITMTTPMSSSNYTVVTSAKHAISDTYGTSCDISIVSESQFDIITGKVTGGNAYNSENVNFAVFQ
jgi:hypothetical protein